MNRRSLLGAVAGLAVGGGCLGSVRTRPNPGSDSRSTTPLADDGEWPMRGRTRRNTRATADATPVSGDPTTETRSVESLPHAVTVAGSAYVCFGTSVIALDPATTDAVWRRGLDDSVVGEPVVAEGNVLVTTERGLVALDADSGEKRWKATTAEAERGGPDPAFPPAVVDGTAYFTSMRPPSRGAMAQHLYAVALDDGRELWRAEVASTPVTATASPATTDGDRVYVGGAAYDVANGELEWRHAALDGDTDWKYGPPTVAGGSAYMTANVGVDGPSFVAAVDSASGEERWRRSVGFAADGVTALDGTLYSGGLALDADSGETAWQVGPPGSPHAVVDGHHYAIVEQSVRALSPEDGGTEWKRPLFPDYSAVTLRPPTIGDGRLYVAGAEQNVGTNRLFVFE